MAQTPDQGTSSRILRAWLILALLFAVMGGLALVYNPPAGAVLLLLAVVAGWRAWRNRVPKALSPGLELDQDPFPGARGGEVGGWLRQDAESRPMESGVVTLACIRLCERQNSQIIEHRRESVWAETRPLFTDAETGALGFCFTPPEHLPPTQPSPEIKATEWSCHHYWTLTVDGVVAGRPASQGFRMIVKPCRETMHKPLEDGQRAVNEPLGQEQRSAQQRLKDRLVISHAEQGLILEDPVRPGAWPAWLPLTGALVLLVAGMSLGGGLAPLLLVAGLALGGRTLYRRGLALHLELEGREIRVTSSWFGRPLFVRHGQLRSRDQLLLKPLLLTGLCDVLLQDSKRRLLLARELPADEAGALRDLLVAQIVPG